MHERGTLVCRPFMQDPYVVSFVAEVNLDALVNEFFLVLLTNLVFGAVPNKGCVFLAELVIWLSTSTENLKYFFILNVFVIENCAWFFPIWVLKEFSFVNLLFN